MDPVLWLVAFCWCVVAVAVGRLAIDDDRTSADVANTLLVVGIALATVVFADVQNALSLSPPWLRWFTSVVGVATASAGIVLHVRA